MNADFLARYLLERPHTVNVPTNGNLSSLLNYVVDELVKYDEGKQTEHLRREYMKTLCHIIRRRWTANKISYDIFPDPTRPVSRVKHRNHVCLAAIYVKKFAVVEYMLDEGQIDLAEVQSEIFDTTLHAAVQMGDCDLVRMLLRRGADVNMVSPNRWTAPLETAVKCRDEGVVRLLLEPQCGLITSGRAFEMAIVSACDTNQPRVAHLLLDRLTDKLSERRYLLCEGVRAACRRGLVGTVQLLLDHGGDVEDWLSFDRTHDMANPIEQAAWTGQVDVMRLLLARGANPYGSNPRHFTSMRAAAWGGHVGAARLLLDAGAELKPRHWMRILQVTAPRVGSAELSRLLLDRGNFDKRMLDDDPQKAEDFEVHLVASACQQGNVGFIQALAQHGVSVSDEALYKRQDLPPPIVMAMVFRQNQLVPVLQELGARVVDPHDTICGGDFVNGKFPCDPPPVKECSMPWRV